MVLSGSITCHFSRQAGRYCFNIYICIEALPAADFYVKPWEYKQVKNAILLLPDDFSMYL